MGQLALGLLCEEWHGVWETKRMRLHLSGQAMTVAWTRVSAVGMGSSGPDAAYPGGRVDGCW